MNCHPKSLNGQNFLLASFGNCRCASDAKAIRQFDTHARVPSGTDRIALGHETLQIVLEAPDGANVKPGDVVVVTPGHATEPIDPLTFEPSESWSAFPRLGYSYRYLGRVASSSVSFPVPEHPAYVKAQGFGNFLQPGSRRMKRPAWSPWPTLSPLPAITAPISIFSPSEKMVKFKLTAYLPVPLLPTCPAPPGWR